MSVAIGKCAQQLATDTTYLECLSGTAHFLTIEGLNATNLLPSSCRQNCPNVPSLWSSSACCESAQKAQSCAVKSVANQRCKQLFDQVVFQSYQCGLSNPQYLFIVLFTCFLICCCVFIVRWRKQKSENRLSMIIYTFIVILYLSFAIIDLFGERPNGRSTVLRKWDLFLDNITEFEKWKRQLRTLLWKNYLLQIRSPLSLLIEQILPLVLASILVVLINISDLNEKDNIYVSCIQLTIPELSSPRLDIYAKIQPVCGLFFLICFSQLLTNIITALVLEKESRIREGLRMMGMRDGALITSWYLNYLFVLIPLCLTLSIETYFGHVFPNEDLALIFFFLLSFGMSCISFCHLLSCFFSRVKPAIIGTLTTVYILYFLSYSLTSSSYTTKALGCLSAPTCFGVGLYQMMGNSAQGTGFLFKYAHFSKTDRVFSIETCIWIMIVDSFIYITISWYLDKVLPKDYGIRLPWNFIFQRSYWEDKPQSPKRMNNSIAVKSNAVPLSPVVNEYAILESSRTSRLMKSDGYAMLEYGKSPRISQNSFLRSLSQNGAGAGDLVSANENNISNNEELSQELQELISLDQCIEIDNLSRIYSLEIGEKTAVKNLKMQMFSGQITCLLGHNGAGKTTTISMLTGLIQPTNGDAKIFGASIKTEMNKIRESMGVCPQHDVLYDLLTVREHLQMYASLKCVPEGEMFLAVQTTAQDLGSFASTPFILYTLFISSGLVSRMDYLVKNLSGGQKRKLSVAIAFLGNSKLVFLDEPTAGMDPYSRRLTWDVLQNNRRNRVIVLTTHFMDEADILGDRIGILANGELQCCGSSLFLKQRYGTGYTLTIVKSNYSTSSRSLFEIITKYIPAAKIVSNVGYEVAFKLPIECTENFPDLLRSIEKCDLIADYGISVTTLEEVFLRVALEQENPQTMHMNRQYTHTPHAYTPSVNAMTPHTSKLLTPHPSNKAISTDNIQTTKKNVNFLVQFKALFKKRFRYAKRDRRWFSFALILPIVFLLLLVVLPQFQIARKIYEAFGMKDQTPKGSTKCIDNISYSFSFGFCCNPEDKPNLEECVKSKPQCMYFVATDFSNLKADCVQNLPYSMGFCKWLPWLCNMDECCNFLNPSSPYYPCQSETPFIGYRYLNWNMKCPKRQVAFFEGIFNSFLNSGIMLLAFSFLPSAVIVYLVVEKEVLRNAKHLQIISGMKLLPYYASLFTFDFAVSLVPICIAWSFLPVVSMMKSNELIFASAILILMFVVTNIPLTYAFSFRFTHHSQAQIQVILFHLITGLLFGIFSYLLQTMNIELLEGYTTKDLNEILRYFLCVFPGFALIDGLMRIQSRLFLECVSKDCILQTGVDCECNLPSLFSLDVSLLSIVYMAVLASLAVIFIYIKEVHPSIKNYFCCWKNNSKDDEEVEENNNLYFNQHDFNHKISFNNKLSLCNNNNQSFHVSKEPADVREERTRVETGLGANDLVQLQNLHKFYKTKNKSGKKTKNVVIHDLSFGIEAGECFGYLGFNGAGKTTTMKILTGMLKHSSGKVLLNGLDLDDPANLDQIRDQIGYCPQHDAHLDLLTVQEHLELYAQLRGLSSDSKELIVKEKLEQLQLVEYADKLAHSLSGGNKRKLSAAIALIGNPKVLFLDEPSTGMDPYARRFMWDVLADVCRRDKCAIMLTTHSMEECEALCSKAGILSEGRLQCVGNIQNLKNQFSSGYLIDMRVKATCEAELSRVIASLDNMVINRQTLEKACDLLGNKSRVDKIHKHDISGWVVSYSLDDEGSIDLEAFADWWLQEDYFDHILDFFAGNFPECCLQERLGPNISIQLEVPGERKQKLHLLADIFSLLQENLEVLNISEFSLSQTTLDQVFTSLATEANHPNPDQKLPFTPYQCMSYHHSNSVYN